MKFLEGRNDKIWFLLSIISGLGFLALWLYTTFIVEFKENAFGDKWVFNEIVFLSIPKKIFSTNFNIVFEFKLITLFVILGIFYWIFGLEVLKKIFIKLPILVRKLLFIISLVGVMMATYEFIWNFTLWNAKIVSLAIKNPDFINVDMDGLAYLNQIFPVNLNFATKMYLLALFISIYCVYYFYKLISTDAHSSNA
ncbi:MAG: hypothetical protein O2U61_01330 [Candidatus Bathyarchaeota archaeon]|nr:hypothetical protein [Candidatus Bathyarchaeota archaeon]MCZ2845134.1 hypothetical protein [Candidatus Bathyarchaeota archaeon]